MAHFPETTKPETSIDGEELIINLGELAITAEELMKELHDPSWDYSAIWSEAHEARVAIERAIARVAEMETATDEGDRELMTMLEAVGSRVGKAIELLKKS